MSFSISDNTLIIALYSNGDPFLPTYGLSVFCCRMTQRTKTNLAMVRSTWLLYLIPVILVLSQGIAGPTHQRAQLQGSVFSSFGKIILYMYILYSSFFYFLVFSQIPVFRYPVHIKCMYTQCIARLL